MGTQSSVGTVALNFDSSGKLTSPTGNVSGITASGLADGAANLTFQWNLYNSNGTPLLSQASGSSTTSGKLQNGYSGGSLTDYSIGADGTIMGTFNNGQTGALGQIALANFANTQGLQRVGDNDFTSTLSSGQAVVGQPGTGGLGTLSGGSLELSNVDVATEFSALIVAQRDYEANARTITTFDQIMQDTINLKPA